MRWRTQTAAFPPTVNTQIFRQLDDRAPSTPLLVDAPLKNDVEEVLLSKPFSSAGRQPAGFCVAQWGRGKSSDVHQHL